MTDIIDGRVSLLGVVGLATNGGFSYGDVLGAGAGLVKSVLLYEKTTQRFESFFKTRNEAFALGVCIGRQFLSRLTPPTPRAEDWPKFERNVSEQYEARPSILVISNAPSHIAPSRLLGEMSRAHFPFATTHGKRRVKILSPPLANNLSLNSMGWRLSAT